MKAKDASISDLKERRATGLIYITMCVCLAGSISLINRHDIEFLICCFWMYDILYREI